MLIFLFFLISKLISCQKENNSYLIEEATPYLFTIGPHEIFFQQYDTSFQYRFFYFNALFKKVTICPLVQVILGENVVADVPAVTLLLTAHFTASA